MNSLKEGLEILIAVLVLGIVLFGLWYLFVYMPAECSEPSGTLVQVPGRVFRVIEAESGKAAETGKLWLL